MYSKYVMESMNPEDITESIFMNYMANNYTTFTKSKLVKEIDYINEIMTNSGINQKETVTKMLEKYNGMLKHELQERLVGNAMYKDYCIENIRSVCGLSEKNIMILESLDIYPDKIEDESKRLSSIIESYETSIPNAGLLITNVLPAVVSLCKHDDTKITESMLSVPSLIKKKINNERYCPNIVEYAYIIKESYNNLYYHWAKSKDTDCNTYSLLESTSELYNELTSYIDKSIVNPNSINHENTLLGKIVESAIHLMETDENIPLSDAKLTSQVLELGNYIQLYEATGAPKGARSKKFERNMNIEKKTRQMYLNRREKVDNAERENRPLKQAGNNVANAIMYSIEKMMSHSNEERRKRLVENSFRSKLWKVITKAATSGVLYLVGGKIFAIVGLLGSIAIDKGLDAKTRRQMLKEFDTEIQVIDEKISDARSAGKRREKYHLMRLKNKLESERTRVRYGLRE